MKIFLLLNSVYPYYTGGRETWIYNITQRLCQYHEIFILTERPIKGDIFNGVFSGIDKRIKLYPCFTLRNIPGAHFILRSYLRYVNQMSSMFSMRKKLKKLLPKKEQCILIVLDTLLLAGIGRWVKKNYSNVKFICSVRSTHAEIAGQSYPILKNYLLKMEINNLSAADQIWANGYDTQQNIRDKGFDSVVVKNGVDFYGIDRNVHYSLDKIIEIDEPKILAIGTLSDIKGYVELIEAIALLHSKYHLKVHLIALGKGKQARYINLARSLSVECFVHFLGEDRRTIAYAKKSNVVACLSGGSGLSMACLEALASGTPVIAWDTPVYRQMITHLKNGYLVNEKNSSELADGIAWLLNNSKEALELGREGKKSVEKYDWSYIIIEIKKLLENLSC